MTMGAPARTPLGAVWRSPCGVKSAFVPANTIAMKVGAYYRWYGSKNFIARIGSVLYGQSPSSASTLIGIDDSGGSQVSSLDVSAAVDSITRVAIGLSGEVYVAGPKSLAYKIARFDSTTMTWSRTALPLSRLAVSSDGNLLNYGRKVSSVDGTDIWTHSIGSQVAYGTGSVGLGVTTLEILDSSGNVVQSGGSGTSDSVIATDGSNVYVARAGGVFAYDSSLSLLWSDTSISGNGIALNGSDLWVCGTRTNAWTGATDYANVWKFNKTTGAIAYTFDCGYSVSEPSAASIAVTTSGGDELFWLSGSFKYWGMRA